MGIGEAVRQGDVYLTRLADLPDDRGAATDNRQLAPGSTRGSRHIVAAQSDVTITAPPKGSTVLVGPVIESRSRLLVEHPEHGHIDLPPGIYQTSFQRDYARERAEEIRRVQD